MQNRVTYEWVVEQSDEFGDILDTSAFDALEDAWKFAEKISDEDVAVTICLRRDVGNECDGLIDRQYAYAGDNEFEYGAAIPKRLWADFQRLSHVAR